MGLGSEPRAHPAVVGGWTGFAERGSELQRKRVRIRVSVIRVLSLWTEGAEIRSEAEGLLLSRPLFPGRARSLQEALAEDVAGGA